jgi:hypothetical protein
MTLYLYKKVRYMSLINEISEAIAQTNPAYQEFVKRQNTMFTAINEQQKRDEAIRLSELRISFSDLVNSIDDKEKAYLSMYVDSTSIDFFEAELRASEALVEFAISKRVQREYFFSRWKYIEHLNECIHIAKDQLEFIHQGFVLNSKLTTMELLTVMLQLSANGVFEITNYSSLGRFIAKNMHSNDGEQIKSSESLISKIRRYERGTDETISKVRKMLASDKSFHVKI